MDDQIHIKTRHDYIANQIRLKTRHEYIADQSHLKILMKKTIQITMQSHIIHIHKKIQKKKVRGMYWDQTLTAFKNIQHNRPAINLVCNTKTSHT